MTTTFENFITRCSVRDYEAAFEMAQKFGFSATHSNRSHDLFFSIFNSVHREDPEDMFTEYETLLQDFVVFLDFLNDLTKQTNMLRSCLYDDLSNLLGLFVTMDLKISNMNVPVSFKHDFIKTHAQLDKRKKTLLFYFVSKMNKIDPGGIAHDDDNVHALLNTLHRQSRILKEATDCLLKIK